MDTLREGIMSFLNHNPTAIRRIKTKSLSGVRTSPKQIQSHNLSTRKNDRIRHSRESERMLAKHQRRGRVGFSWKQMLYCNGRDKLID